MHRVGRQGSLDGLVKDQAQVVYKVVWILIIQCLKATLSRPAVNGTFQHLPLNLRLFLTDDYQRCLLFLETVGEGVADVSLFQAQVIIEQVVDHGELEVLLQLLKRCLVLGLLVDQVADEMIVGLVKVAEVRDLFAQVVTLLLLQLFKRQVRLRDLMVYLLNVGSDKEVLDDLSAFFLRNLVYVPQKRQQRVKVKEPEYALTVLINALEDDLVDLCVALAEIRGFIRILIHCLDDRV